MTTVANTRTYRGSMADAVYVGRPSAYGNPFHVKSFDRAQSIAKFRTWWYADARADLRQQAQRELKDKTLLCWCSPLDCHAQIIADYVNWWATGAVCTTCASKGFEPSVLGPACCTFCDGTFGGLDPLTSDCPV